MEELQAAKGRLTRPWPFSVIQLTNYLVPVFGDVAQKDFGMERKPDAVSCLRQNPEILMPCVVAAPGTN